MLNTGIRKISITSIFILILNFCTLPTHVVAIEDSKAKIDRIVEYEYRSNRLSNAFYAVAESLDAMMDELNYANDTKDFSSLPSLEMRVSDERKNLAAHHICL